ncbi:TetR/AcrR family transcriptional regulator [Pigmentiphaga soli]|uniref:TetR/AcrR family transcriptional regulator n=1 Tax=Pigmentiphaga soli TaxID=1007095 RepID=A0ABP8GWK2_9BURK
MTRIRLTREQSRDQTRQRLMDAAQSIFIERGVAAASVEEISEAAGYTRGAFYSNFDSKLELFLALLRRDHDRIMRGMEDIFDDASAADMEARVLQYYSTIYRDNKCFLLWVEARMQAVRDPQFKERFAEFVREKRQAIIDYIDRFAARVGTPLPLPPKQLALGLVALCDGMQFFHTLDPQDVPDEVVQSVLDGFFRKVALDA